MSRYTDYKNSSATIKKIDLYKKDHLIIHYSCESFYGKSDGYSPRVTSIAIKKLDNAQSDLFAIHKIAEIKHISFDKIESYYDELEKEMLKRFYTFVKYNKDKIWIHWNMRDSNYGFAAIEHRAEVLGIKSIPKIDDINKIDLAVLFKERYGQDYAKNPRIQSLVEQNLIKPKDLLYGKVEAEAFENQEYIKLGMSSASKVDLFAHFLNLSIDNKLIVRTNKFDIYGLSLKGILAMIQDNTIYTIFAYILNLVIGGLIGVGITSLFN